MTVVCCYVKPVFEAWFGGSELVWVWGSELVNMFQVFLFVFCLRSLWFQGFQGQGLCV